MSFKPWEYHRNRNCMDKYDQWWWCKFAIAFVTNALSLPPRFKCIITTCHQSDPRTGVLSCGIELAISRVGQLILEGLIRIRFEYENERKRTTRTLLVPVSVFAVRVDSRPLPWWPSEVHLKCHLRCTFFFGQRVRLQNLKCHLRFTKLYLVPIVRRLRIL